MRTVLVVEDEKMIRRGICKMIQRSGVPVEVIIECSNGEEALEILQEQEVDVMFTDIRMPKMDGIELVNRVQRMEHQPLIVTVSGYDDFSYAVEMLRHGVREYILKPVERTKIAEIMEKFQQEFEENREKNKTEHQFGKQQIRYVMLHPELTALEMQLLKEKYDAYFFQNAYVVCAYGRLRDLREREAVILVEDADGGGLAIVDRENLGPFLKNEFTGMPVGISRVHKGIDELRIAYEEAAKARKTAFCTGVQQVYSEGKRNIPSGLQQQAEKLTGEPARLQRLQLVGTDRTEELKNQWRRFFHAVKKEHLTPDTFLAELLTFLKDAEKTYKGAMTEEDYRITDECRRILAFSDIESYEQYFMDWLLSLHEKVRERMDSNRNQQKIHQAIAYIQKNYNQDLNMAVVSNYISMNYSLFSLLFKQHTGTNFVTYLKEIRIGEAKKLLVDTDMRIIEISQKVGYDNEKNFMKVFKNTCGVSPTEYRRNMRGKP